MLKDIFYKKDIFYNKDISYKKDISIFQKNPIQKVPWITVCL